MFSWLLHVGCALAAPATTPSAASFYVETLPGLDFDPSRPPHIYAGHLASTQTFVSAPATEITPHLYFFMLKARKLADKERIIFWFNGGPGCSSFDGLMLESGGLRTDGKGGLKFIEGSWDEYTTIVFVDQPVGTGFSYTSEDKYTHELGEGASQVVQFMRNFYDIFPEFKSTDTYIAGESYAGQFIPYIADAILSSNLPTTLKGLAIGNGWIDGVSQYPAYLEYALEYGIISEDMEGYDHAKSVTDKCTQKLRELQGPQSPDLAACEDIVPAVTEPLRKQIAGKEVCMNVYDVRLSDDYPACGANWPPELTDVTTYLRRSDVVNALHATTKSEAWKECNPRVGSELTNKNSPSSITLLPALLEKIELLLFSGDQDFICNYMGTEKMIDSMDWNGGRGLGDAETLPWMVDGANAGTWVTARNLTYAKVYNASHMVPYDLPIVSHDMMLRFMGVDISKIADGTAKVPSNIGSSTKPALDPTPAKDAAEPTGVPPTSTKTAEQDKAMWEAYYNAGSAALTLLLIAMAVGIYFFCRQRRRRLPVAPESTLDLEETIPLRRRQEETEYHDTELNMDRNGAKATETVFEVGDSDGEEHYRDSKRV